MAILNICRTSTMFILGKSLVKETLFMSLHLAKPRSGLFGPNFVPPTIFLSFKSNCSQICWNGDFLKKYKNCTIEAKFCSNLNKIQLIFSWFELGWNVNQNKAKNQTYFHNFTPSNQNDCKRLLDWRYSLTVARHFWLRTTRFPEVPAKKKLFHKGLATLLYLKFKLCAIPLFDSNQPLWTVKVLEFQDISNM
jgi:hypothetical protein